MLIFRSRLHYYFFSFICVCACFHAYANEAEKKQLLSYVNQYHQNVQDHKFEDAAIEAKNAYELSQKVYNPSDKNHLIISEEYALILLQIEKYQQAIDVLQIILNTLETEYSKHDKQLLPILGDLKMATKKYHPELYKQYSTHYTQLYLRYNSHKYVDSYIKNELNSTQQAINLANKLSDITQKKYKIYNAGQWDLIYNEGSDFNFNALIKQMDKGYRSALGFLISFNVLAKPPEDKLRAVFFSSREDYQAYLLHQKSHNATTAAHLSSGLYAKHLNTLFLFDAQFKNNKKNKFRVLSTLRHEIAHQLFFNLGLQSRAKHIEYPRWLTEGLATSLEFYNVRKISGPQTQNFSFFKLKKIKEKFQEGKLTPISELVSISAGSEGLAGKNTPNIYFLGGFLVKFLYEKHPDELRKYIRYLTKTPKNKLSRRASVFYRHFGDRESLQTEFDAYLTTLITYMDTKRAKFKKKANMVSYNSREAVYYTLNSLSK